MERVHLLEEVTSLHTSCLMIENKGFNLYLVIKNDEEAFEFEVGKSEMIFDGFKKCSLKNDKYILNKPGVYIIRKDK